MVIPPAAKILNAARVEQHPCRLSIPQGGNFSYRLTVAFGAAACSVTLSDPPSSSGAVNVASAAAMNGGGGGGVPRGGLTLAEALLRACWTCLCAWPSQPDVCENSL